ncbi:MAG: DNA gyrase inhibitor YacG [Hyphomicrobiales bacterium]|nr:DNA gyrase inhibitor YacG [Hyphomicrobiales bacterium]
MPESKAKLVHLRPKRPCPICQTPSVHKYHPFCSARCADIDLHKWLGGHYAVPAVEQPDFEDVVAAQEHSDED